MKDFTGKYFGQTCLIVEKMRFLENEARKKKEGWIRVLGFENEMTLLPSLIKNDHFALDYTKSTCHFVKKM